MSLFYFFPKSIGVILYVKTIKSETVFIKPH